MYNKEEVYNKENVYNKEKVYNKEEVYKDFSNDYDLINTMRHVLDIEKKSTRIIDWEGGRGRGGRSV